MQTHQIGDTQQKLSLMRKQIQHGVLQYNLQESQQRRNQKTNKQSQQAEQINQMLWSERESLKREQDQNRINIIRRRQMLKDEYERQIREKEARRQKEAHYNKIYADIEKDYCEASEKRRAFDIQKMFNRKGFEARISQRQQGLAHHRVKTQPDAHNPEMDSYLREKKHIKLVGQQRIQPNKPFYRDSIDDLNVISPKKQFNLLNKGIGSKKSNF